VKKKERLTTLGIYYDDDYDYEQHVRDADDMNICEPDRDIDVVRVGATAAVSLGAWGYSSSKFGCLPTG
jgi:hypothetical protein